MSAANTGSAAHVPSGHSTGTRSPSFPDLLDSQSPAASDFVTSEYLDVQYDSMDVLISSNIQVIDDQRSRHARRRHVQAHHWSTSVLPTLIQPYMRFQRECSGAHQAEEQSWFVCKCGSQHHSLEVVCVHMERVEDITLDICKCRPALVQLVQCGFFPCSPVCPTLAVSLDMLEFIAELFLHIAPNERGWAAMLVKYLKAHGYRFVTADSFRRRFANALAHYQQLVRLVDAEVEKLVDHSRALSGEDCVAPQLDETTLVNGQEYSNAQNTATFPSDHNVPSTYLQTQCPLCFGSNSSENGDLKVDAIVCLNVNFQLKCQRDLDRRTGHQGETGTQDPFVVSPRTIELLRRDLELWEAKILDL